MAEPKKKKKLQEDKLVEIVKADEKLTPSLRFEYITLAKSFVEDFRANLMLTSIDLNDKYPFGIDVWQEFLAYPAIKKYNEAFVDEIISRNTDAALASGEGVRDAVAVKKALNDKGREAVNANFIVFRLPDKEDDYNLSGEIPSI